MKYIRLKDAFNKSKEEIVVRNINDENEKNLPPRHSALLPNTIRALIIGPSNCGKTNIMLSLIESPNGFKFEKRCQENPGDGSNKSCGCLDL